MITCVFENGNKASLRHVVVDTLVLKNNKILLVKRAAHVLNPDKYGLVGGYVERDETIEQALKREVLEETGYEVDNLKLFRVNDNPNRPQEDRQNIAFVYTAQALEKVGDGDDESHEVKWHDLDKLPPKEEFAFDHYEQIELYLKHLKKPLSLPIIQT